MIGETAAALLARAREPMSTKDAEALLVIWEDAYQKTRDPAFQVAHQALSPRWHIARMVDLKELPDP